MPLRRILSATAAFLFGAIGAGGAYAFAPSANNAPLELPLAFRRPAPAAPQMRITEAFPMRSSRLDANWTVRFDRRTGFTPFAFGGGVSVATRPITSDAVAISAARDVFDAAGALVGVTEANSEVVDVRTIPGKTAVHFRQLMNGVPVEGGDAFVAFTDAGDVIAFGSSFIPENGRAPGAALSADDAIAAAAFALSTTPREDAARSADLVVVPTPVGDSLEGRLTWRVLFDADAPFGRWETFVDAATGEIVGRRNFFHTVNVTGVSQGDVEDFGYCDGVATKPFKGMRVNVTGGSNATTDATGNFNITHGGTTPVTVTAQFLGPFINVNRYTGLGADASFSGSATPGTPLTINWVGAAQRADERDSFFHGNRVHDFMKEIDATFTDLDYAMVTSVGRTDGFCPGNAWWDGSGMNYCEAGAGSANTGRIGNVVYHEFGHGVTQEVYSPNNPGSDIHEGNSDVLANLIDRQPIIGLGFTQGNCANGIRNSDNELQWPTDISGEGHHDGQIIAGFLWDAWQAMLAALPQAEADDVARQNWHQARKLGKPQSQPSQVDWTFLVDDDDANLANGTPHHEYYCLGATNHGFDCPEITEGVFITHTPISGIFTDGSAGFDVVATIVSSEAALDAGNLLLHYRLNGAAFTDIVLTTTGNPDEFSAHIPALNGNSDVEYYISAADVAANSKKSPPNAPVGLYAFEVVWLYESLESGSAGWQIGAAGDNASGGIWQYCDPIGTTGAGFQCQPEDDATLAPGVNCFVTAQCGPPQCPSGCTQGCSDVDAGTTTLLSAVWDLTGAAQAKVKYARWYSNNTGGAANSDLWTVDVSNDGGSSWTTVESTTNTIPSPTESAEWVDNSIDIDALFGTPGPVRLRFRARDTGTGSVVEAGVDDVRIFAEFGAVGVDDIAAGAPLAFALAQNQPNPFSPATRIDFALPTKSHVSLGVFDVGGRHVRTLAQGPRDAGRYSVQWDGKDSGGNKVAAGVYFYRLSAGKESLTRKMTVLK